MAKTKKTTPKHAPAVKAKKKSPAAPKKAVKKGVRKATAPHSTPQKHAVVKPAAAYPAPKPSVAAAPEREYSPVISDEKAEKPKSKLTIIVILIVGLGAILAVFQDRIVQFFNGKARQAVETEQQQQPAMTEMGTAPAPATPAEPAGFQPPQKKEFDPDKEYYTVQPKDQLTEISKKYFGTVTRWQEIYRANRDILDDYKKIYPGQKLVIPGVPRKK